MCVSVWSRTGKEKEVKPHQILSWFCSSCSSDGRVRVRMWYRGHRYSWLVDEGVGGLVYRYLCLMGEEV